MEADTIAQLVTVVIAALGIVWHQHHSINQLREDTRQDLKQHRQDLNQLREDTREDLKQHRQDLNQHREDTRQDLNQLREDTREDLKQHRQDLNTFRAETREDFKALREDHNRLGGAIAQIGQRLARIEGHLGIGLPPDEPPDPTHD